jgi:hypothetical protein
MMRGPNLQGGGRTRRSGYAGHPDTPRSPDKPERQGIDFGRSIFSAQKHRISFCAKLQKRKKVEEVS